MKTIKITNVFTDLKEGIMASDQAYGLDYYAGYVVKSKMSLLSKCHQFYLLETGKLAYITYFRNRQTDSKYGILHIFSWISISDNSRAAIVTIQRPKDHEPYPGYIHIGEYKHCRDDLRRDGYTWTTDTF